MHAWSRGNRLTSLLGIDVPILTGAFGGMSSVELTALVSERGGMGAYGLYGYPPDRIRETVARLRGATAKPFLLNVWVIEEADALRPAEVVVPPAVRALYDELGLPLPDLPERLLPSLAEQVDALVEAAPAAAGFVFGVPDSETVRRLHAVGTIVVGTATTPDEAVALERAGVDAVVASGAEAGGHKPSFLQPADESLVGTAALVPRIADAVSVPVIAAGGIGDGRGVAAAMLLGADGVQIGTAFLATRQSAAPPAYRAALRSERAATTVLTRASSGRWARGIPNRLFAALGADPAPFPVQNVLTGVLRAEGVRRDDAELLALWCGQAAPVAGDEDAAALLARLATDAERLLAGAVR
ncbi:MAG: NAD(P)H-dependent flavin oxidoreductase [Amnibacterium sp.]